MVGDLGVRMDRRMVLEGMLVPMLCGGGEHWRLRRTQRCEALGSVRVPRCLVALITIKQQLRQIPPPY